MFLFGMFILALLTYLKKSRPPSRKGMRSTPVDCSLR
ncbi:putative holin-like toxin [Paenibacillus alvei]|nr:putative holin-like toxin [Paenibacillus alvei]